MKAYRKSAPWWAVGGVGILLVLFGLFLRHRSARPDRPPPSPVRYSTLPVDRFQVDWTPTTYHPVFQLGDGREIDFTKFYDQVQRLEQDVTDLKQAKKQP